VPSLLEEMLGLVVDKARLFNLRYRESLNDVIQLIVRERRSAADALAALPH
jgi:hypothetical protein